MWTVTMPGGGGGLALNTIAPSMNTVLDQLCIAHLKSLTQRTRESAHVWSGVLVPLHEVCENNKFLTASSYTEFAAVLSDGE